jgi:hypothetical protein
MESAIIFPVSLAVKSQLTIVTRVIIWVKQS